MVSSYHVFAVAAGGSRGGGRKGGGLGETRRGKNSKEGELGVLGLAGFVVRQSLVISHNAWQLAQSSIITTVANCDNESLGSIEFQERDEALKKQ